MKKTSFSDNDLSLMVNLLLIFVYKVLSDTTVKCNGYPTKATLTCGGGMAWALWIWQSWAPTIKILIGNRHSATNNKG